MSEWFFSSAMTIGAVLAIRQLAKKHISHRLRYALWLLVLVRLLIPVQFLGNGLSLARLVPVEAVPSAESERIIQIWYAATATGAEETLDSGNGWLFLWLAGVGMTMLIFINSRMRLERRLHRDRVRLEDTCCSVPVYVTAAVNAPCLVGLFRPVVYVTEAVAGGGMLRHVLLHEMTHLRYFDHLWSVLRCVALALHWFNPLVWMAAWLSKEDGELACDEGVLESLEPGGEIAYGSTLIQLSCKTKGGTIMGMNTLLNGKSALRRRVGAIAHPSRTRRPMALLLVVLCALTSGCAFSDAPETTQQMPSIQMQAQPTEPVQEPTGPQPGYDVWERVTENILTEQEEELFRKIPEYASGDEVAVSLMRAFKCNLYCYRARCGAKNAGIVSVEEVFDERAEPGVRIYEIRTYWTEENVRQERSDYLIWGEYGKGISSDLDSCFT